MTIVRITIALALGFGLACATASLGAQQTEAEQSSKPDKTIKDSAKKDQANITFLDEQAGRKAIIDDKLEPYFDQMQPMEMSAKTGSQITGKTLAEQQAECRRRFQDAVRAFTDAETEALSWYVNRLHPVLSKDYPLLAAMPWSFIKVSAKLEGGMPHTRDKHIVLSERTCKQMLLARQMPAEHLIHMGTLVLLVHEQIHVYQRTHRESFDALYKQVWGFEKAKAIAGCDWLVKHHLINPDGVDCTWVMPMKSVESDKPAGDKVQRKNQKTTYLWPLVVFAEGEGLKRMPGNFRMLGINVTRTAQGFTVQLDDEGKPVFRDLKSISAYRSMFPVSTSIFHPHEIAADMFGYIVLFDYFLPKGEANQDRRQAVDLHLAKVRKWFRANLAPRRQLEDKGQARP